MSISQLFLKEIKIQFHQKIQVLQFGNAKKSKL